MIKNRIGVYCIICLLFVSCGGPSKEALLQEKLTGTWLFKAYGLSDKKAKDLESVRAGLIKENNQILNLIQFDGDETVWVDTGGIKPFKGKYILDDTLINIKFENDALPKMKLGTLAVNDTARIRFFAENTEYLPETYPRLLYEMKKMHTVTALEVEFRKQLAPNASEAEIKAKLKTMLDYYTRYTKCLIDSKADL